ncbi:MULTISPECIES: helix-hairpin-helix domain-containing protein [unclassified Arthrobacter]|uniref:helix-hairpin-helix domain-containing protein n=1 Tax=unclassified Arthrobacter TaxID=235627 RepID=UPI001E3AE0B0|nr:MULTISPECIES: helix-hairpin-helix domain-containing protein [unclassified Arthrobacter]MCC9145503.1 helix-hairpin-helix domain-containing protein [Arthrobacter sp. zg-Y919]MDK1276731.1 helix-hairpin-helix domain-containing protein [Arthrobacter sp. zg.Y919]WIB04325.1 helix-hairpin-helix domain-containing protein [Arthrobacter sp. zg-Y919]
MAQHRWDTAPGTARDPALDGIEDRNGRGRRWAFSLPAAVLAVCLLLGCGAAALLLRDRDPVPVATVDLPTAGGPSASVSAADPTNAESGLEAGEPTAAVPSAAAGPTGSPAAGVVVHVAGAVHRPGVVTLKPGSRIVDAVDAAGGTVADADLSAINLAAVVEDGVMVFVPRVGEEAPVAGTGSTGGNAPGGSAGGSSAGGGGPGAAPVSINVNTADSVQLQTLPRVGPVLAERIIAWRTDHGKFLRPEDLDAVPGIGEAMMAALLPLVTV